MKKVNINVQKRKDNVKNLTEYDESKGEFYFKFVFTNM